MQCKNDVYHTRPMNVHSMSHNQTLSVWARFKALSLDSGEGLDRSLSERRGADDAAVCPLSGTLG